MINKYQLTIYTIFLGITLLIVTGLSLCPNQLIAQQLQQITLGTLSLTFISEKSINPTSLQSMTEELANTVEQEHRSIVELLHLKPLSQIKIIICNGAWIFKQYTNLDASTAGLYVSNKKTLYLQRVAALKKQSIFQSVLRHELTHALIDFNRTIEPDQEMLILEEALCETIAPQIRTKNIIVRSKSYREFIQSMDEIINMHNAAHKQKNYALLKMWGGYLRKQKGDGYLLSLVLNGSKSQKRELETLFLQFYKTSKKTTSQ